MKVVTILAVLAALPSFLNARAAPIPTADPQPTVASIRATLNKSHLGKEVRVIGNIFNTNPTIQYSLWRKPAKTLSDEEDRLFYLLWKPYGISMNVEDGKVIMVALYNTNLDGYQAYQGQLPDGLAFEDDEATVLKKLGQADDRTDLLPRRIPGSDKEWEDLCLSYPKKGMSVTLRRPSGGKWRIDSITVYQPR